MEDTNPILPDEAIWKKIHNKIKPLGSLGVLEELAFQIAKIQNTLEPKLQMPTLCVFAGDHGIAEESVSAYPQEVTYQMVLQFLQGGAAIHVFCKQHNIQFLVVDAGVKGDFHGFSSHPNFYSRKVNYGTKNFLREPSMTQLECNQSLESGKQLIQQHLPSSCTVVGFGEMGIGNTSSASLIVSCLLDIPLEECTGQGTGLDAKALERKIQILKQAQNRFFKTHSHSLKKDPLVVLQEFGGFEIVMMVGSMLQSFSENKVILVDGFIASSAFLAASFIQPKIIQNAIFCHQSAEKGHQWILHYFQKKPILNLNMRLGEGTGCAVAYPILESAVLFLKEMASFEDAGIHPSL